MPQPQETKKPLPDFESIKQTNEHGQEYWSARDLMPLLDYETWRMFEQAIKRAIESCQTNGGAVSHHFVEADKMITLGKGGQRRVKDYILSRYGCWYIAQNGDVRKPAIAAAQAYFLVSTAENEMHHLREQLNQRVMLRQKVAQGNTALFAAAAAAGVQEPQFGTFEDAGILGQYSMATRELEAHRGIRRGELYDTMPGHELAANLLRIMQTEYNLRNTSMMTADGAMQEHYVVGRRVRAFMIEMSGGELPENIPPVASIKKEIQASNRRAKKMKAAAPKTQQRLLDV